MRRLQSVATPGKRWIVFVALCIALAPWLGAPGSIAAQQEASPVAEQATTPDIDLIDFVEYEDDYILYLVRVGFGPNVPAFPAHIHGGEFVLTVASGAVCYELVNVDSSTKVTASLLPGSATNDACNPNQNDLPCVEDAETGVLECRLGSGDKVYVPEGSWITQEGAMPDAASVGAEHTYGNVDDEPAVVYLAGYRLETGVGCGGTCH